MAELAALIDQDLALHVGFNALGNRIDAQRECHRQDRAHQRQTFSMSIAFQTGDKTAVDFKPLDREAMQIRQRRETGAEIIQ